MESQMLMYHHVSLSVPPKDPNMSHVQKLSFKWLHFDNSYQQLPQGHLQWMGKWSRKLSHNKVIRKWLRACDFMIFHEQLAVSRADFPGCRSVQITEKETTGERRHCKWCLKYKPDRPGKTGKSTMSWLSRVAILQVHLEDVSWQLCCTLLLAGVIIAGFAIFVCSGWITTARGFTTALGFGTTSTSSCCWSTLR